MLANEEVTGAGIFGSRVTVEIVTEFTTTEFEYFCLQILLLANDSHSKNINQEDYMHINCHDQEQVTTVKGNRGNAYLSSYEIIENNNKVHSHNSH